MRSSRAMGSPHRPVRWTSPFSTAFSQQLAMVNVSWQRETTREISRCRITARSRTNSRRTLGMSLKVCICQQVFRTRILNFKRFGKQKNEKNAKLTEKNTFIAGEIRSSGEAVFGKS